MNVFIAWSGEQSKKLAELLDKNLDYFIQVLDPKISSQDIQAGSRWLDDLEDFLNNAKFGILCITSENVKAPWLNFEAGFLRSRADRVVPLLFDVDEKVLKDSPLEMFQAKKFDKDGFFQVLKALNELLDKKLDSQKIENIFNKYWPDMELGIQEIKHNVESNSGSSSDARIIKKEVTQDASISPIDENRLQISKREMSSDYAKLVEKLIEEKLADRLKGRKIGGDHETDMLRFNTESGS